MFCKVAWFRSGPRRNLNLDKSTWVQQARQHTTKGYYVFEGRALEQYFKTGGTHIGFHTWRQKYLCRELKGSPAPSGRGSPNHRRDQNRDTTSAVYHILRTYHSRLRERPGGEIVFVRTHHRADLEGGDTFFVT